LAYEPVWAIGTGENATPEDASAAHRTLRRRLDAGLDAEDARRVAILYGGSVKPANARELLAAPGVDGVLVGGASVDPAAYAEIARAAP
jgi:triosephosphate isomerase